MTSAWTGRSELVDGRVNVDLVEDGGPGRLSMSLPPHLAEIVYDQLGQFVRQEGERPGPPAAPPRL